MSLKKEILGFIQFSKRERLGAYLVLFISSLCVVLPTCFKKDPFPETILGVTNLQIEEGKTVLIKRNMEFTKLKDSFPSKKYTVNRAQPVSTMDVNKADSADFERLPGIGEKLSSRIVKYRTRLGGFIHLHQLKEVYGIQDSVYDKIQKSLFVEKGYRPVQLDINTVEYSDLRKHPYADHQFIKIVLAFRKAHGPFSSIAELREVEAIDTIRLQKLVPYLKCSN